MIIFMVINNNYRRILIKISGEFFLSNNTERFNSIRLNKLCNDLINVLNNGINISLVIGGGNIIRGREFTNNNLINRETADSIGMLSTVINGIIVRDILAKHDVDAEIVSSLDLPFDVHKLNPFILNKLVKQNKLIIFVGGLGLPYFSTDTISVVGASLSHCNAILKATKTDGVYDKDPILHPDAKHLNNITYDYAIQNNLQIMDDTAFSLAKKLNLPIYVFSLFEDDCFIRALNQDIRISIVN
ncbi:MAG: UMP kinase [Alphaproteobacteria bacterium]|nr:UMP kinase [Alphaproteobacteria bacterium]